MIDIVVGCIIGSLCGIIGTYAILKKHFKPLEITEDLIDFIVSDVEMQKKVFLLGAILGNGIKSGIGLNPRKGKFRFEDLIGMALQQFFLKNPNQSGIPENPFKKVFSGAE